MNSFFGDDTAEEEKLVKQVLKKKDDEDVNKLPQIIEEITTSHLVQSVIKAPKEESGVLLKTELNNNDEDKNYYKEHVKIIEKYSKEEKLNIDLTTHIFSFHIKKNGRINADLYFIPYKSQDNKDTITEYTYNYKYYDIYSKNIEKVNKSIHLAKLDDEQEPGDTVTNDQEISNLEPVHKKIRVKSEVIESENEVKQEEKENRKDIELKKKETKNFQKWLVHFRGRLFIGCEIFYPFFNIDTFLATTQNKNIHDKSVEGFKTFHKKIQTYNLIKNAIYWKQDVYPDISDQNIQRLLFNLLIPSLINTEIEEQEIQGSVVF